MLEDILGALVRSQVGSLRRRTAGAVLEGVALGLAGLATVFAFLGAHLWLSIRIQPWLSAVLLALVTLVLALVAMLVGGALLRRRSRRDRDEAIGMLKGLGLTPGDRPRVSPAAPEGEGGSAPGLVLAALAAGLVLGRSIGR
jgi:hypothetical protein